MYVCLVSGKKEYLIDTLTLHDNMHLLQDVLEDKLILKVLELDWLLTCVCATG